MIADHAPVTVRMIKRATYQSANTDLRTALDLISSHFAVVAATEDAAEALAAMKDKRTPQYAGNRGDERESNQKSLMRGSTCRICRAR